jgi:hypothetical protein
MLIRLPYLILGDFSDTLQNARLFHYISGRMQKFLLLNYGFTKAIPVNIQLLTGIALAGFSEHIQLFNY